MQLQPVLLLELLLPLLELLLPVLHQLLQLLLLELCCSVLHQLLQPVPLSELLLPVLELCCAGRLWGQAWREADGSGDSPDCWAVPGAVSGVLCGCATRVCVAERGWRTQHSTTWRRVRAPEEVEHGLVWREVPGLDSCPILLPYGVPEGLLCYGGIQVIEWY